MMSFEVFAVSMILLIANCMLSSAHSFDFSDKSHLEEHLQGQLDIATLSGQYLQFLFFQSHDAEGNNKLDGIELVQSLLHYHAEESGAHGQDIKAFTDAELSTMVDPLLALADANKDGFIDYPEFISGQYTADF